MCGKVEAFRIKKLRKIKQRNVNGVGKMCIFIQSFSYYLKKMVGDEYIIQEFPWGNQPVRRNTCVPVRPLKARQRHLVAERMESWEKKPRSRLSLLRHSTVGGTIGNDWDGF